MKKVSPKMQSQKRKERKLIDFLVEKQEGLCARCGRWPGWLGLSKHEKVFRSHGGDPLDPDNCELLCSTCHDRAHGKA